MKEKSEDSQVWPFIWMKLGESHQGMSCKFKYLSRLESGVRACGVWIRGIGAPRKVCICIFLWEKYILYFASRGHVVPTWLFFCIILLASIGSLRTSSLYFILHLLCELRCTSTVLNVPRQKHIVQVVQHVNIHVYLIKNILYLSH